MFWNNFANKTPNLYILITHVIITNSEAILKITFKKYWVMLKYDLFEFCSVSSVVYGLAIMAADIEEFEFHFKNKKESRPPVI